MKNKQFLYTIVVLGLIPVVSYGAMFEGLSGALTSIKTILNGMIPVIFGLAFVYFFWGIAQFVLKDAGNDKTRDEGKKKILWSIIALFIMVSITGIINWIGGSLDIKTNVDSSGANPTANPYDKLQGQY
ncbi:MAG: hypothetical protein WCK48_03830 [bacterium]